MEPLSGRSIRVIELRIARGRRRLVEDDPVLSSDFGEVAAVPSAILVMGVSGAGKSTLGRALAERLGYRFIEGDDLHPQANVRKMAAGIPLQDEDRWPWLEQAAVVLGQGAQTGGAVLACSALKHSYRDLIRARLTLPLALVYPLMAREALERRMARRQGHYMPVSLLASQFAALEPPGPDERPVVVDGALAVDEQVDRVLAALAAASA
jgi:gluconokinase